MTWGWSSRGQASVAVGGSLGTPDEAKIAHAWPSYEAKYLAQRLATKTGKYDNGGLNDLETHVYLDKVAEDYKTEADECLRKEFYDWLEGKHAANGEPLFYDNKKPGNPSRLKVIRDGKGSKVADKWDDTLDGQWNPTWWGQHALTHLPGVREHLRENEKQKMQADLQMNLLAEFGPQNLEQAWMYFKHWVKGRPVGTDECMQGMTNETFSDGSFNIEKDNIVRSAFGNMPGKGFPTITPVLNPPPESTDKPPSSGATAAAAVTGAAAAGAAPGGVAATAVAAAQAQAAAAQAAANQQQRANIQAQIDQLRDNTAGLAATTLQLRQQVANQFFDDSSTVFNEDLEQRLSDLKFSDFIDGTSTVDDSLTANDDLEQRVADLNAEIDAASQAKAATTLQRRFRQQVANQFSDDTVDDDDVKQLDKLDEYLEQLFADDFAAEIEANANSPSYRPYTGATDAIKVDDDVATAADDVATAAETAAKIAPAATAALRRSSRQPKARSKS